MSRDRLTAALADRYRIERELGQGGMATVYLAEDRKHNRKVAIKVLKPELAAVLGAERFVQEIATTAALQHPHILPLFDSGEADGFLFYVMPFIDGETLRAKLDRETQLGVDEAVKTTTDVADALQYAHEHGVIHRDIKPENILLANGRPMVADFGIALALSAAAGGRMTETGMSLGTPHYMSPEQATAEKEITARSDVYSLASVLYEMLAGQPPHLGGSAQQIIMKIIAEPVPVVTQFRKTVPRNVAAALAKALEKLPADRFENAKAFADALGNAAYTNESSASAAGAFAGGVSRRTFAATAGVAAVAIVVAGWLAATRPRVSPGPLFKSSIVLPDSVRIREASSGIGISRNGRAFVFVLAPGRKGAESAISSQVWYRTGDEAVLHPVPGTDLASTAALSDDGQRIAFGRGHELLWVDAQGGTPSVLGADLATVNVRGEAWTPDGAVISTVRNRLVRFSLDGTPPVTLSTVDTAANEAWHVVNDVLPNGRGVLMVVAHNPSSLANLYDVAVLDLRTGKHRIIAHGVAARYAASGQLVYVTVNGDVMAAPFDENRLAVTGPAVPVAHGVALGANGTVDFALSATGTMMYLAGQNTATAPRELIWVGRDGAVTPVNPEWHANFDAVSISPEGKRIAVSIRGPARSDVWVSRLDDRTETRVTFEGTQNYRPFWFPDGTRIGYVSNALRSDGYDLVAKRADGVGAPELIAHDTRSVSQGLVSPDGKWIVYRTNANEAGTGDILGLSRGDTVPVPLVATPAEERFPALSPDGKWLAYFSMESGRADVYVRPFPNTAGGKWAVSPNGGGEPIWSHTGKELFYINLDNEMVAATVQTQPNFAIRSERTLFKLPSNVQRALSHQAFDLSPDDRRFIMIRTLGTGAGDAGAASGGAVISVVQNWFEALDTKVGPRK